MKTRTDLAHREPPATTLARSMATAAASVDLYSAILAGRNARTVRAYEGDYKDFARFLGSASPTEVLNALVMQEPGAANAVALGYREPDRAGAGRGDDLPATGRPAVGGPSRAVTRPDRLDARRRVAEVD